jgi:hypothetical protein
MDKKALIKQIQDAFANVPYPADGNISQSSCGGTGQRCEECQNIQDAFVSKRWQDLRPNFVLQFYDSLPLLTPNGLRYFLPAYLFAGLTNDYDLVAEFTIYALCPPIQLQPEEDKWYKKFGETKYEYFIHRMQGYTSEQKAAIASYLRFQQINEPFDDYSAAIQWWETSEV